MKRVLILGGLSAFGPLSIDMYLPGLPHLTRDLGASASTGQLTLTACVLGLALGQLLAGPLSDSLGRRKPLLVGLAAYAATSAVCALAPTIWVLIGLRFLQGMAGAAGIVIARAVVRDLYSGEAAAKMFAALMLVLGIAPVFAPLIGGQALRVMSWRGIFVVLAAIGLLLLAAAFFGLAETLPPERRHAAGLGSTLRTFGRLMRDRGFMSYAGVFGLAFGAMFAYIAGSPFVLEDVYGVSPQVFSLIFAVNSACLIAATQVVHRLVERRGSEALLRAGVLITAGSGIALLPAVLVGDALAWVLPCLLVLVTGIGFMVPTSSALALEDQGWAAGSASALLGLGQFALAALVAPLPGVAGQGTAVPMAIVIAACCVAALSVEAHFHGLRGPVRGSSAVSAGRSPRR